MQAGLLLSNNKSIKCFPRKNMELAVNNEDAELAILESIYSSQKFDNSLTQRDLAVASGLSLGMTNALLKRFS